MDAPVGHVLFLSDLRYDIRSSCGHVSAYLEQHWQAAQTPTIDTRRTHRVDVCDGDRARIDIDAETAWLFEDEEHAEAFELLLYRRTLADHEGRFSVFHAAAVADDEHVLVFCGPSGAGKSSLALAAVRRGHQYFTDEFFVTDGHDVWGWPRALRFDPPTPDAALPPWLADLDIDPCNADNPTSARFRIVPPDLRSPSARPVRSVHFVAIEHGAQTTITPMQPLQALQHWHEASFFEPPAPLGSLCGAGRCWRASWRTPDELLDALELTLKRTQAPCSLGGRT